MKMKLDWDWTIMITFFILMMILISVVIPMIKNKRLDEYCQERGYEEMTDKKREFMGAFNVECDGKVMGIVYGDQRCTCEGGRDKWGDCIKERCRYEFR